MRSSTRSQAGVDLAELPLATLQGFHPAIGDDVHGVLTPARLARLAQGRRRHRAGAGARRDRPPPRPARQVALPRGARRRSISSAMSVFDALSRIDEQAPPLASQAWRSALPRFGEGSCTVPRVFPAPPPASACSPSRPSRLAAEEAATTAPRRLRPSSRLAPSHRSARRPTPRRTNRSCSTRAPRPRVTAARSATSGTSATASVAADGRSRAPSAAAASARSRSPSSTARSSATSRPER